MLPVTPPLICPSVWASSGQAEKISSCITHKSPSDRNPAKNRSLMIYILVNLHHEETTINREREREKSQTLESCSKGLMRNEPDEGQDQKGKKRRGEGRQEWTPWRHSSRERRGARRPIGTVPSAARFAAARLACAAVALRGRSGWTVRSFPNSSGGTTAHSDISVMMAPTYMDTQNRR